MAKPDRHSFELIQIVRQFLGDHHGAMPPSSATDGHGQVGLALLDVLRHHEAQKADEADLKLDQAGRLLQEPHDGRIEAGEPSQFRIEVRVLQKAHIKDEIRLRREADGGGKGSVDL